MGLDLDNQLLAEVNVVVGDFGILGQRIPTDEHKGAFVGREVEDKVLTDREAKTRDFKDYWRQFNIAPVISLDVDAFYQLFVLHIAVLEEDVDLKTESI